MIQTDKLCIEDVVKVAKRDNNIKRPYVLVNPLQGKHIPVQPNKCLQLFGYLAEKLYKVYKNETILIIGFAETATAIGAGIACSYPIPLFYIHTTREQVKQVKQYLYFSEIHSHATEQKLAIDLLIEQMERVDRVIFAEDEVTTGNTICNLMDVINKKRGKFGKYGIVSILNGITKEKIAELEKQDIVCTYLFQLQQKNRINQLLEYTYSERLQFNCSEEKKISPLINIKKIKVSSNNTNTHIGVNTTIFKKECFKFATNMLQLDEVKKVLIPNCRILVLGTEEFMYPPMIVAKQIQDLGICKEVKFHATTRSPILPSEEVQYPLNKRFQIRSIYDKHRITYLYNLKQYDFVFIISDANSVAQEGICDLIEALELENCKQYGVYQWGE